MGEFIVKISHQAEKELEKTNPKIRNRILEAIRILEDSPVPAQQYDVIKLSNSESSYRIRISSHRMAYTIQWDAKNIDVTKIDRRTDNTYK